MTDIVDRLITQHEVKGAWSNLPEGHVFVGYRDAAIEIERLRGLLDLYRDAVQIDVTMEGPVFMGCKRSALKYAWDRDIAALSEEKKS